MLALTGPVCQVRLLETATGTNRPPDGAGTNAEYPYCFSPDGSRLAALGAESQLTYLWDLRALRADPSARLDLDWNAPPYAPVVAAPAKEHPSPFSDPGD